MFKTIGIYGFSQTDVFQHKHTNISKQVSLVLFIFSKDCLQLRVLIGEQQETKLEIRMKNKPAKNV